MQEFKITGQVPIQGEITPQGNKNEALPILCAALLNANEVTLRNVPNIKDIQKLIEILEFLGAKVEYLSQSKNDLKINTVEVIESRLSDELSKQIRGSVTLLAPILARMGSVYLPRPGGDKIGRRRVDTHLMALEALGAKVEVFHEGYQLDATILKGANILLDEASVTGTENAVMAASVANGITKIENAACEPHVQGLCNFLVKQGVKIEGIGSNVLTIYGLGSHKKLKSVEHTIGPDYLEIGSFISMAALTGGALTIKNVNRDDLRMIRQVFRKMGIEFTYRDDNLITDLILAPDQSLTMGTDVHGEIAKIDDAPWPAFPADLISIAIVTATQCKGTILFHEKMFESRLYFTDKLVSMGAKIVLCDPHRALVIGPTQLFSAKLSSPDIRAGMALVIAALAAEGESVIQNIIQVDRGYEKMDERLTKLGAKIERRDTK